MESSIPLVVLLGGSGGLLVLCLGLLGFTLWRLSQYTDPAALASKVRHLEMELTDIVDRVDAWMRREQTRAARKAKDASEDRAAAEVPAGAPGKAALRSAAAQIFANQRR